jgi:hypothetical protein
MEASFCDALKFLLENKHLYQKIKVEVEESKVVQDLEATHHAKLDDSQREKLRGYIEMWQFNRNWIAFEPLSQRHGSVKNESVMIEFTHANLVCDNCQRRQAYNTLFIVNVLNHPETKEIPLKDKKAVNIFLLKMQCQSCKSIPEAILVKRVGSSLMLTGRSSMEHLEVSKNLPSVVRVHYRDAKLAYNSGQLLPAIFMLRTAIEQWVYHAAGKTKHADEALDAYMKLLPDDFKDRFYSLKSLYSELSAEMHEARGSDELYTKAINIVDQHFEAMLLFQLLEERRKSTVAIRADGE